jgi:hypothetical protein
LVFAGLLSGLIPGLIFMSMRNSRVKWWFACPTQKRLLFIRTKGGPGGPSFSCTGVESISDSAIESVEAFADHMTLRMRHGADYDFRLDVPSGGVADAARFRSGFPTWLKQLVEAGRAAA